MRHGRYVDLAGHRHWVVEAGAGRPLLLLHGGLDSSEAFFGCIGDRLASDRRVIGFDRIGHGRTADRGATFHYAEMARETAAMLATLGPGPVDICGWSDGGIVGLLLALGQPPLLGRMVLIGANFHHDIMHPEMFDPEAPWLTPIGRTYVGQSPDGATHFAEIVRKSFALWASEPALTTDDLGRIATPTLVLNGDRDALIPLAHTLRMFEAIPGAELAIVPGAGHSVAAEKPALTAAIVAAFLDTDRG